MRLKITFLLGIGLLLLAASAVAANQAPVRPGPFLNPKLKAKEVSIRKVVVLPCIVEVTKQGVKGQEGMAQQGEDATNALATAVAGDLAKSGLAVETPFTDEALKNNNDLKYAVSDVQRKYDEIAPQMYRKPKDIRKGRFSLTDMVAVLNSKGDADALVFVHSDGVKLTKGKGALSGGLVGLAMSGSTSYTTRVVLADAKNGDILFMDNFMTSGLPKDKVFVKSFQKLTKTK
jgi:hypothetical protein